jgi:hypothetical protein
MAAVSKDSRLFVLTFLVLLGLHVALISTARLFPFTDLPDHLAAATIARDMGEPSNDFASYYRVDLFGKPNIFHLVFCGLTIFPSVELANRIFLILYAVLLPTATLALIVRLGGNPWCSLLSFLLLYNYNVGWGFVGFAFSIPLVLLFYRLFIVDATTLESAAGTALAALSLVLLFFVHILAALFCLVLLFLDAASSGARARRTLPARVLAVLPFVALAALWSRGEVLGHLGPGILAFLANYYRHVFSRTFESRLGVLVFDNYYLFAGSRGWAVALLFSCAILASAGFFAVTRRSRARLDIRLSRIAPSGSASPVGPAGSPPPTRPASPISPVFPLVIGSLLCVLVLPNGIPQQSVLYERFSVFLFLSLILWAGANAPRRLPRAIPAVLIAFAFLHFILWSGYVLAFNRENAGFDGSFLEPKGRDMTLAGLMYDYRYRGKPIYIHFPSYYIVWERSAATAMITDYRFGPVRRAVGPGTLPRYLEWVARFGNYDGRYRDMDYLLVRGRVPGTTAAEDLGGFGLVRTSGDWALYGRIDASLRDEVRPKNN